MRSAEAADHVCMAKQSTEPSGEDQAMTPEMRDLIARFDAKDRRDDDPRKSKKSKERRRRSDKPVRAT
jgi:hypothetical protein